MTNQPNCGHQIAVHEKEEIQPTEGEPKRAGVYFTPAVDIYENAETLTLVANLPGVRKEDLDIDVEDGVLSVIGQVNPSDEPGRAVRQEYRTGGYMRRFRLGKEIDYQRIDASLTAGVLTVRLPKSDHLRPRKIQIAEG